MTVEFHDPKKALQEREYTLKCKVQRVHHYYYDERIERNEEANLIFFPLDSERMETSLFLSAHFDDARPHPETGISRVELPCYIGSIGMLAKCRLQWPNQFCDRPHLFLISVGVEAVVNARKDVSEVEIKVFPPSKLDELGLMEGRFRG